MVHYVAVAINCSFWWPSMRLDSPARGVFDIVQRTLESSRRKHMPSSLRIGGLQKRVEIITDNRGVAHIYAETRDDLFFAQGFVTARDRLFQIDYNRHGAGGRLAEMLGMRKIPWRDNTIHVKERTTFDVDVMLRAFGLARAAKESLPLHSPAAQQILEAYAAGVNAFLATGKRSIEHQLMGLPVAPWSPTDSLLMLRAVAFELNFAWRAILYGALLQAAGLPGDVASRLCPHVTPGRSSIIDEVSWARIARDLVFTRSAADTALGFGNAPGVGSNCVAVAASHSASGDALLANDTHLTLTAPLPWHEIHMVGGGFDLQGFAVAGVPGIGIGRTPAHTWGITAGLVQDLDVFAEKLHPRDANRYLTPDGWQTLHRRREVFSVRGEGRREHIIRETRHGPLLQTIATRPARGMEFAVAWSGHRPSCDLDGLLGMWTATSREEFFDATRHLVCPPYAISYAGACGDIGFVLAGAIPRRRHGTPVRPLPGWTGEWDWQGFVPREHLPRELDPERGYIVTANNRPAPGSYPYELGGLFEAPHRFNRLRARLEELGDHVTREDLAALQLDTFSAWGRDMRDSLLGVVGGTDGLFDAPRPFEREAAEIWRQWDGDTNADSSGAAIGITMALKTGREVVRRLAGDDAAFAFAELGAFVGEPALCLERLAPRLAALGVDVVEVVRFSFRQTLSTCREAMGDEPSTWKWGVLHPMVLRHRLSSTFLGNLFDIGPQPVGGAPDTVNRGDVWPHHLGVRVGPAMRFVASARNRDAAGTILPAGQSGDRLSQHYDDQLRDFLAGRLKPAPVNRELIDAQRTEKLVPLS
ncbi:MAG: hypothetical protein A2289_22475 [Deltaproteobacteria bacterium RIFOXYA12_FULL_58_15]|nr:MAG: hypothetical protein A2289_22475 [Deltaproteobacteria bacterium RIFOXYA12_FULL_58_15]OGR11773.1 MAG: hypothetical protein A2341_02500 [Deltaproteobacteria bacterium RIFOXYB12_FULL_58_9]